ncbi:rRNA biogenesis protein rrp36 [Penicillium sp. IBT 35674x]|nr:rRNA biogenesis protein rrp36 [Penicillium sp. IBT 35674x]
MAISDILNRRVRAGPGDEEEDVYSSGSGEEVSQDENEDGEGVDSDDDQSQEDDASEPNGEGDDDEDSDDNAEGESSDEDDNKDDFQASLSNISFGALAKAQASMGPKKRKEKADESTTASPLDDIRAKIREAREQKREAEAKALGSKDKKEKESRKSKHAPMEQSSKRAVTRRRTVVEPPAVAKARDPRFDAAVMGYSGAGRYSEGTSKAYAFLDEYRASELKDLKEQFGRTKNPAQKEALKAQIRSATDRMKADESKKREREIMAEHKKHEKQLIREGKKSNPYFLKKSDLKKQVLEKKYESMKSKDRAKAMERRRKKMASKERKEMPWERRGMGGDDEPPNFGKRRRLA